MFQICIDDVDACEMCIYRQSNSKRKKKLFERGYMVALGFFNSTAKLYKWMTFFSE